MNDLVGRAFKFEWLGDRLIPVKEIPAVTVHDVAGKVVQMGVGIADVVCASGQKQLSSQHINYEFMKEAE